MVLEDGFDLFVLLSCVLKIRAVEYGVCGMCGTVEKRIVVERMCSR